MGVREERANAVLTTERAKGSITFFLSLGMTFFPNSLLHGCIHILTPHTNEYIYSSTSGKILLEYTSLIDDSIINSHVIVYEAKNG